MVCLRFEIYPPASEASREVANLTERKNPHALYFEDKKLPRLAPFATQISPLLNCKYYL